MSVAGEAQASVLAALHRDILDADWPAESIARLLSLPGAFALLVSVEGAAVPVGYAICVPGGEGFDLAALGVAMDARRKGIGRALVNGIIEHAARFGARELTLEVAADNGAACRLYGACGFTVIARRANYYASGPAKPRQDAIVMQRLLK